MNVSINVLAPPAGVRQGCKKCKRIFVQGKAVIEVSLNGVMYFLAPHEPFRCCGEERKSAIVFPSKEAAIATAEDLRVIYNSGNGETVMLVAQPKDLTDRWRSN
ncbi:MAG: hypothetical protein V4467_04115 [Patescibacteria group bacterium]